MSSPNRRTLGTILIWLGVLAWAPFLTLAASDRPDELVLALRGITSSSGRGRGDNGPNSKSPGAE